jgi:hypothetical protein
MREMDGMSRKKTHFEEKRRLSDTLRAHEEEVCEERESQSGS